MILESKEYIIALMEFLYKKGIPYEADYTNNRIELSCMMGRFMNKDAGLILSQVNFIKRVKTYILKNELFKKIPRSYKSFKTDEKGICEKRDKIRYFYYNKNITIGSHFENCWEVDLSAAYWESAWQMGLLSKELYEEGLSKKIAKKTRLAALGSLARIKTHCSFDGKKESTPVDIRCIETEFLWFVICNYTAKVMFSGIRGLGADFLFYWVDAVMLKSKTNVKALEKHFKKKGFKCTVEPVKSVTWGEKNILVDGKRKWVDGRWVGKWVDNLFQGNYEPGHWVTVRPFPYAQTLSIEQIQELVQ
jgi:hypothetical protein